MVAKKKEAIPAKTEEPSKTTAGPKKVRPKKKPAEKIATSRGKRKEAVARASVRKGTGRVTLNRLALATVNNKYLKSMMYAPIALAGSVVKELDIDVDVYGGGPTGQAEAVAQAIARGILEFTGDAKFKEKLVEYDRYLLVEDARRVEPKKYKGPKARARFQKSYR